MPRPVKNKGTKSQSQILTINLDKLEEMCQTDQFYSYKELCSALNIPYISGNSKIKQLNQLSCICEYEKVNSKYSFIHIRDDSEIKFYRHNAKYTPYIELILSQAMKQNALEQYMTDGIAFISNQQLATLVGLVNHNLIYMLYGDNAKEKQCIISDIYGWKKTYQNKLSTEVYWFAHTVMQDIVKPIIRTAMKSLDNRKSITIQRGYKIHTITNRIGHSAYATSKNILATSEDGIVINQIVADVYTEFDIKNSKQLFLSNNRLKQRVKKRCDALCKERLGYDYFSDCYAIIIAKDRLEHNIYTLKYELNKLLIAKAYDSAKLKSCSGFNKVAYGHFDDMVEAMVKLDSSYDFKKDVAEKYKDKP